jgi:hypothetical protein
MAKVVLPRVHVLVLCDEIEPVSAEGNVYNLLGVRTEIRAETYPHVHPRLDVYMQVTGHEGTVSGEFVIIHAQTEEEVFRGPTPPLSLQGPLRAVSVFAEIDGCEFPEPGIYYFQVFFGQKLLCEGLFSLTEGQVTTNGRQRT